MRSLAGELNRYRKQSSSSSESDGENKSDKDRDSKRGKEHRDPKGKSKENVDQKSKDRLKSLENELKFFSKRRDSSSSSGESEEDRPKKATTPPLPPPKVTVPREVQRIKTSAKSLKSLANELSMYRKQSDSSSDSSSEEGDVQKKNKTGLKNKATEKNVTSDPLPPPETRLFDNSQVKIPGICDSYEDEPETNSAPNLSSLPLPQEPGAKDEAFSVFNKTSEEDPQKIPTPVKEKRRWDVQEAETRKKVKYWSLIFY